MNYFYPTNWFAQKQSQPPPIHDTIEEKTPKPILSQPAPHRKKKLPLPFRDPKNETILQARRKIGQIKKQIADRKQLLKDNNVSKEEIKNDAEILKLKNQKMQLESHIQPPTKKRKLVHSAPELEQQDEEEQDEDWVMNQAENKEQEEEKRVQEELLAQQQQQAILNQIPPKPSPINLISGTPSPINLVSDTPSAINLLSSPSYPDKLTNPYYVSPNLPKLPSQPASLLATPSPGNLPSPQGVNTNIPITKPLSVTPPTPPLIPPTPPESVTPPQIQQAIQQALQQNQNRPPASTVNPNDLPDSTLTHGNDFSELLWWDDALKYSSMDENVLGNAIARAAQKLEYLGYSTAAARNIDENYMPSVNDLLLDKMRATIGDKMFWEIAKATGWTPTSLGKIYFNQENYDAMQNMRANWPRPPPPPQTPTPSLPPVQTPSLSPQGASSVASQASTALLGQGQGQTPSPSLQSVQTPSIQGSPSIYSQIYTNKNKPVLSQVPEYNSPFSQSEVESFPVQSQATADMLEQLKVIEETNEEPDDEDGDGDLTLPQKQFVQSSLPVLENKYVLPSQIVQPRQTQSAPAQITVPPPPLQAQQELLQSQQQSQSTQQFIASGSPQQIPSPSVTVKMPTPINEQPSLTPYTKDDYIIKNLAKSIEENPNLIQLKSPSGIASPAQSVSLGVKSPSGIPSPAQSVSMGPPTSTDEDAFFYYPDVADVPETELMKTKGAFAKNFLDQDIVDTPEWWDALRKELRRLNTYFGASIKEKLIKARQTGEQNVTVRDIVDFGFILQSLSDVIDDPNKIVKLFEETFDPPTLARLNLQDFLANYVKSPDESLQNWIDSHPEYPKESTQEFMETTPPALEKVEEHDDEEKQEMIDEENKRSQIIDIRDRSPSATPTNLQGYTQTPPPPSTSPQPIQIDETKEEKEQEEKRQQEEKEKQQVKTNIYKNWGPQAAKFLGQEKELIGARWPGIQIRNVTGQLDKRIRKDVILNPSSDIPTTNLTMQQATKLIQLESNILKKYLYEIETYSKNKNTGREMEIREALFNPYNPVTLDFPIFSPEIRNQMGLLGEPEAQQLIEQKIRDAVNVQLFNRANLLTKEKATADDQNYLISHIGQNEFKNLSPEEQNTMVLNSKQNKTLLDQINAQTNKLRSMFPNSEAEQQRYMISPAQQPAMLNRFIGDSPNKFIEKADIFEQNWKQFIKSKIQQEKQNAQRLAKTANVEHLFQRFEDQYENKENDDLTPLIHSYQGWQNFANDPEVKKEIQNKQLSKMKLKAAAEQYGMKTGQPPPDPDYSQSSAELDQQTNLLNLKLNQFEQDLKDEEELFKKSAQNYSKLQDKIKEANIQFGASDAFALLRATRDPKLVRQEMLKDFPNPTERKQKVADYIEDLDSWYKTIDQEQKRLHGIKFGDLQNEYNRLAQIIDQMEGTSTTVEDLKNKTEDEARKLLQASKQKVANLQATYDSLKNQIRILRDEVFYNQGIEVMDVDEEKTAKTIAELEKEKKAIETERELSFQHRGYLDENGKRTFLEAINKRIHEMNPLKSYPEYAKAEQLKNTRGPELEKIMQHDKSVYDQLMDERQKKISKISKLLAEIETSYAIVHPYNSKIEPAPTNLNYQNIKSIDQLQQIENQLEKRALVGKGMEKELETRRKQENERSLIQIKEQMSEQSKKDRRQDLLQAQIEKNREVTVQNVMTYVNDEATRMVQRDIANKKLKSTEGLKMLEYFQRGLEETWKRQDELDKRNHEKNMKEIDNQFDIDKAEFDNSIKTYLTEAQIDAKKEMQIIELNAKEKERIALEKFKKQMNTLENSQEIRKTREKFKNERDFILKEKNQHEENMVKAKAQAEKQAKIMDMQAKKKGIKIEHRNAQQLLEKKNLFQQATQQNEQQFKQSLQRDQKLFESSQLMKTLNSRERIEQRKEYAEIRKEKRQQTREDLQKEQQIEASENYIEHSKEILDRYNIPYVSPGPIVTSEQAEEHNKYFRDLVATAKEVPAKRKKLANRLENLRKHYPHIDEDFNFNFPQDEDIGLLGAKEIDTANAAIDEWSKTSSEQERNYKVKLQNKNALNLVVDSINKMKGSKEKINQIDFKNAPTSTVELERLQSELLNTKQMVASELAEANTKKQVLFDQIEEQRKKFSPEAKQRLPLLTKYYSHQSQKSNLQASNLTDVDKDIDELNKIYLEEAIKLDIDTRGKQEKNTLDVAVESLRNVTNDPTMLYKLLQNAAHKQDLNEIKVDPMDIKNIQDQARDIFEQVASSEFLKNTSRNTKFVETLINNAKKVYEATGMDKIGTNWETIAERLNGESEVRKEATVEMIARSEILSEMYLISLAADYATNPNILDKENPVKLYTAMKSMGIPVQVNTLKGKSQEEQNRELLKQIPPKLLGETKEKQIASLHDINEINWRKQLALSKDQYSDDWIRQNMIVGNTDQQAVRNIMNDPSYSKKASISRLDLGNGNFYPVSNLKQVKAHEPYFINKPSALRNFHPLKKDKIMLESNALTGPFGLSFANDKRRRNNTPLYNPKSNYVNLARFLNSLPATRKFQNKKEKFLNRLQKGKQPERAKVKKHILKNRNKRKFHKKIKGKRPKKKKFKKLKSDEKDDERIPEEAGKLIDDDSDDDFIYSYDKDLDHHPLMEK